MVELRIRNYWGEIPGFLVQLRMSMHLRFRDTPAGGKRLSGEGNNPDYG